MISTLYIENAIADHPRTQAICARFPNAVRVACERYGEVFNPRAQSFRLQKKRPALILAEKHGRLVIPTPEGYGIGAQRNFYFSHMVNCLYDCRYCFLQGMYRSANYVVFVNYESFFEAIEATIDEVAEVPGTSAEVPGTGVAEVAGTGGAEVAGTTSCFFSGYDCDSLAFEGVTHFVESTLPIFAKRPEAWLELRTKSTRIDTLLAVEPMPNVVVAFSFTPSKISEALEHKVPSVERRIRALRQLSERGWPIGLRFDPLIWVEDYARQYRELFDQVLAATRVETLHSVSLGPFRLPTPFFHRLEKLYSDEPLLAAPLEGHGDMVSYRRDLESELVDFCTQELLVRVPSEVFFPCELPTAS